MYFHNNNKPGMEFHTDTGIDTPIIPEVLCEYENILNITRHLTDTNTQTCVGIG